MRDGGARVADGGTCTSLVVSGEYAHVPSVLAIATSCTFVAT